MYYHGGKVLFIRLLGSFFLQFWVESAQLFSIVEPCNSFALLQTVDVDHAHCESQKTKAFNFSADRTFFAFFGAHSPAEFHYLDCSLVSDMYQLQRVSSTVTKRCKNFFRIALRQCQILLMVALDVRSEQTRKTRRFDLVSKISCRIKPKL